MWDVSGITHALKLLGLSAGAERDWLSTTVPQQRSSFPHPLHVVHSRVHSRPDCLTGTLLCSLSFLFPRGAADGSLPCSKAPRCRTWPRCQSASEFAALTEVSAGSASSRGAVGALWWAGRCGGDA